MATARWVGSQAVTIPASTSPRSGSADVFEDARGRLTLVPWERLPFTPARGYVLSEIPAGALRAGHASRTQQRFLLCLAGLAALTLDDGRETEQRTLAAPQTLHIPPGTWLQIQALDDRLSVLVLADGPYDEDDYVHDRAKLPLTSPSA
jgi:dTDP-4-dehydrorhamnose 3,5-epimerase-like enzyme